MPLPFIIGITSIVKMKNAKDKLESAQCRHENNIERFNKTRDETDHVMGEVGKLELDILSSFEAFSDTIEKIQGRPEFKEYSKEGIELPKFDIEDLKRGSIGAGVIISECLMLGSGLVGMLIANATIKQLSTQADEAWSQMRKAEKQINQICDYLNDLRDTARKYNISLTMVYDKYKEIFAIVSNTVNVKNKIYWKDFTQAEKTATQNSVMLVALLYKMCQVKLVKTSEEKGKENTVNHEEINGAIVDSYKVMAKVS